MRVLRERQRFVDTAMIPFANVLLRRRPQMIPVRILSFLIALSLALTAAAKEQLVPISAVAAGANGTLFRTDVRIFNPSSTTDIQVEAQFLPINADGTNATVRPITVPKRQMLVFDNAVASLFSASGLGAMRFRSNDEFTVTSRTYTDSPNPLAPGTFGQFIPALEESRARLKGVILHLSGSSNLNLGFRSNTGVMNPNLSAAMVTFRLYSTTGILIKESAATNVPPRSVIQAGLGTLIGRNLLDFDNGYVTFESNQPLIGYSSVVDNRSSDQIFVAAVEDTGSPLPPATASLSIGDVTVTEGNSGTTNAMFTVGLSATVGQTVTAQFATANGTAEAGTDYVASSGTVTIPAGSASSSISVAVNGDTTQEQNETFVVNLTNAVNAPLVDSQGVGTINNDDEPASTAKTFEIAAREFAFTINPGGGSRFTVTVGDRVVLKLRSIGTETHGFQLPPFVDSVNLLSGGSVVERSFTVTEAGTFPFFCTVSSCGTGHDNMIGTMVVSEAP